MSDDPNGIIRITNEDAASDHVDDLLRRQMSLRGEPGVTRDRGRKWYYQNWVIFTVVGLIGAVLAWAIIEPNFDDLSYLQGPVSLLKPENPVAYEIRRGHDRPPVEVIVVGTLTVNGQEIVMLRHTREIAPDGSVHKLNFDSLKEGETIGVYVDPEEGPNGEIAVCAFVVRSPKPLPSGKTPPTLAQLESRSRAMGMVFFSIVAGMVSLFIGAADGIICRQPRRALLCGGVGLLVGLAGGFISNIAATVVYQPLSLLAMKQADAASSALNTFGFMLQMFGRSVAWALAGLAMGLGQGIALRSKRLLIYGFIGGIVGGLLGGLLFDPIEVLLGQDKPSAHWSRLVAIAVIGATVGAMIGIVELLARDAWLRMLQGPLVGKEFLLFKDVMKVGASPRSDIYLFNDPLVAENHATIRTLGDECEIDASQATNSILLNNRPVRHARLRHGDNVTIGRTVFVFQRRKG
jgi:type III secretion system (T3SS) inner membrane Yop/YscD-like protein